MKNLLALFALICSIQTFSQVKTTSLKVVPIVQDRTYELDGGIIVLNTSRVMIPIDLPSNTVEWYYVFTSYSNEDAVEQRNSEIDLVSQLTYIIDETGTTAGALSTLLAPTGSSASNIYLLSNYSNARNFVNKTDQDLFPTYWKYYSDQSISSAKQGKQKVNFKSNEKLYLGIQAGSSPVIVDIEIVAIVDESVTDYSVWSESSMKELKDLVRVAFEAENVEERQAIDLSNCIVDSLTVHYTPDVFFELNEDEITSILEEYASTCSQLIDGSSSGEQKKAVTYGNLGWEYFESGNIEKAIEYSNKALQIQNDLGYVKANLALFFFIQGDESKGNDFYIDALMDLKENKLTGRDSLKAVIDDIENAAKKYSSMHGYEMILKELKREYEQW